MDEVRLRGEVKVEVEGEREREGAREDRTEVEAAKGCSCG